jgi:hypothetical protein
MIRIDEIYSNTFWPFIKQHLPSTRMFFCDPPGTSDQEHLFNYGNDTFESNYILFHDQEPIHLDIHASLFDSTVERNLDLYNGTGVTYSAIVTSEHCSEYVDTVCSQFNWKPYYYFFHGWASLDWYRGYDKTFLIPDPQQRVITKSFVNPNRIVGGHRQHRVLLMYNLLKKNVANSWTSFPAVCPYENQPIIDIVKLSQHLYPDIQDVFASAGLPWNFPGETDHPMHSCWLSLYEQCAESVAYVVTETVFSGRRHHLTEKTFKPICLQMPFVLVSTAGSLEYLRSYGFQTFDSIWDESYDTETDDVKRIEKIADLLLWIDQLSETEKQHLYQSAEHIVKHNFEHFYNGNFEKILWEEIQDMFKQIQHDFK